MPRLTLLLASLIISLVAHSSRLNTLFRSAYNGKDTLYEFTGKLVETVPIEAGCNSSFGFAIIQKFEVVSTTCRKYKKKFVLIIQPCPEEGGEGYFQANRIYKMTVATTKPDGVFAIQNLYPG